jgi:hypothetical protein
MRLAPAEPARSVEPTSERHGPWSSNGLLAGRPAIGSERGHRVQAMEFSPFGFSLVFNAAQM